MSAAELDLWEAFDLVEPIGEYRADLRTAMQCLVMAKAAGAKPLPPVRSFLPFLAEPRARKQTQEEIHAFALGVVSSLGGTVTHGNRREPGHAAEH